MLTPTLTLAVKAWRDSIAAQWIVAEYAETVVGQRDTNGRRVYYATSDLANNLNCSPDTVERLARASLTYNDLKRYADKLPGNAAILARLATAKETLGYLHWAHLGKRMRQDDIPHLEALLALDYAVSDHLSSTDFGRWLGQPTVDKSLAEELSAEIIRCQRKAERYPEDSAEATAWGRLASAFDVELSRAIQGEGETT